MASSITTSHCITHPIPQVTIVAYNKLDMALQNMVLEDSNPKRRQGHGAKFSRLVQYPDGLSSTLMMEIPICKFKKMDDIIKGRVIMKMQPSYDPRKSEFKSSSKMQSC